jgi:phosphohistidine phosphatase
MQLFVIRHAIAAELEAGAPEGADAQRPLTRKGIQRFRQSVQGMGALGISFSSVLHSPWRRAVETAHLVTPLMASGSTVAPTDLMCRAPGPALLALIAEQGRSPVEIAAAGLGVAVVGHEPWLGELIGLLTAGGADAGESLVLKKGSVSWLEGSAVAGGMSLRALLPPRVLRAVRG